MTRYATSLLDQNQNNQTQLFRVVMKNSVLSKKKPPTLATGPEVSFKKWESAWISSFPEEEKWWLSNVPTAINMTPQISTVTVGNFSEAVKFFK